MSFHSPTVALIKMAINSLQEVTIEHASSGILPLAISFIHLKDIKMQYIVWLLMCPLEIRSVLALLTIPLKYGAPSLARSLAPIPVIQVKL
jgi:hypothetical protein